MKLAAMLWIIIGSMMGGGLVIVTLVVPKLPVADGVGIAVAGIAGYLIAIPAAIYIAKRI